ncbi:hypothetical protein VKT23_007615 [Stygiomarasmius scandens]|uniref:Conidiation-specific protein 6 n=1 Tax=Marasmiellus scandens TaxID=2682957 RepID=A0ABR1JL50_9AGAR
MSSSNNQKNPERVAAGLKGTLHNDNVSDEAKQRASERLQEMGVSVETPQTGGTQSFSAQDADAARPLKGAVNSQSESGTTPQIVDDAPVTRDDDEYKPESVLGEDPEDEEYEYGRDEF